MRPLARSLALTALMAGCLAPSAAAMPSPYPTYDNRPAPALADGVHGPAPGSGGGSAVGTAPSSSCNAATRSVIRAKRKVRSLKRKLRRARSRSHKRALRRAIRVWNRRVRGRRRAMRRRCAGAARVSATGRRNRVATIPRARIARPRARAATTAGGAYFRSRTTWCDNGFMYMRWGPDIRSQSSVARQAVAFRLVLFRQVGNQWVYDLEYPVYWWNVVRQQVPPLDWVDERDQFVYGDQGFVINVPGNYRMAVRYHWWPFPDGGRQDTSYNWAGLHQSLSGMGGYCSYSQG